MITGVQYTPNRAPLPWRILSDDESYAGATTEVLKRVLADQNLTLPDWNPVPGSVQVPVEVPPVTVEVILYDNGIPLIRVPEGRKADYFNQNGRVWHGTLTVRDGVLTAERIS